MSAAAAANNDAVLREGDDPAAGDVDADAVQRVTELAVVRRCKLDDPSLKALSFKL